MEILNENLVISEGDLDHKDTVQIRPFDIQVYFPEDSEISPTEHLVARRQQLKGSRRFSSPECDSDIFKEYIIDEKTINARCRSISNIVGKRAWDN